MRAAIVIAVVVIALAVAPYPAAAQSPQFQYTLKLRYWDPGLSFSIPTASARDPSSGWGGSLRIDFKNSPWSLSGQYDSQSVSLFNAFWDRATFADVNVHYRSGSNLNSYFGLLAGYGWFSLGSPFAGFSGSASGIRIGGEFLYRQPSGWYVTGDAAFGPSWSTNVSGLGGALENASVTDLRIAVGYEFKGGLGLEAGWRSYTIQLPFSSLCASCQWQFSGVTAALTFRQ